MLTKTMLGQADQGYQSLQQAWDKTSTECRLAMSRESFHDQPGKESWRPRSNQAGR